MPGDPLCFQFRTINIVFRIVRNFRWIISSEQISSFNWILFSNFDYEKLIFDIKRRVEGKSYRRSITLAKNNVLD